MVDVTVSVPKERLGEFYSMLATFFGVPPSAKRERGSANSVEEAEGFGEVYEPFRGRYAPLYEYLVVTAGLTRE